MKEKIMNIKNILRIIISLLVIFSMIKSCAKALTYEDLKDYVNATANLYSANSYYQRIKNVVNQQNNFYTYINDGRIPLQNYSNIQLYVSGPSGAGGYYYINIEMYNVTSWVVDSNSIRYNGTYQTAYYAIDGNWWSGPSSVTTAVANNHALGYCCSSTANYYNSLRGMNYTSERIEDIYTTPLTYVGMQAVPQWNYLVFNNALENTAYNGNLITYYFQGDFYSYYQIQLGTIEPNDSYYYELRLKDNNGIVKGTSYVAFNTEPNTYFNDGAIYVDNSQKVYAITRQLKYSTQYQLEIESYYGDGGTDLYEDIDWFIFLPTNAVIDNNTITSLGSGDFTIQDSTNQIIDNQDKNNTFWQDTYNSLFVMNSGDVDQLITNMKENIKIDNFGDVSGEIAILNTLTGEPSDFIIAWNSTQYMGKTIIPSGEINFSQKVREVPALKTTQDWLRIIMGYSITIVLMSEIFFTILRCLGVGVSIYEQHNEEIERLEEMHTPKIYDTEVMTPKGIKRYRTRRTRIQ